MLNYIPTNSFDCERPRRGHRGAFTLAELLVILGLIAVVVALLIPRVASAKRKAGQAQLLHAAENGDLVTVKSLVEQGVLINCTPELVTGIPIWTPLHGAVFHYQTNVIYYLVEKGADVNATNQLGQTPLMLLVTAHGDEAVPIAKLLIEHGADLNAKDRGGTTVLTYVRSFRNRPKLTELLSATQEAKLKALRGM